VIYRLDHVVETGHAGSHVLDFGCCRIEFGGGRETPTLSTPRTQEQALTFLNRVLGSARVTASKPQKPQSKERAGGRRVEIANASFEEPATPFFDTAVSGWQKEGDPAATGVFRNFPDDTPIPGSRFVENADGEQLATIAARRGSGLFQAVGGATAHAAGKAYVLSAHVGVSSVQPPAAGAALRVSLVYSDDGGRHEVAGETVSAERLNAGFLTRVSVSAAAPAATAAAAVGIVIRAADANGPEDAGHFILDDVTLTVID
jgi:hypothetical protein